MSKAEEEANKRYSITRGDDTEETSGIDMQRASDFIEGYHQAEKDLELTWEDIEQILDIINNLVDENFNADDFGVRADKEFYQEVLKRFNRKRNERPI